MSSSITTKIAAGTTLAALGGLAGMAVRPEHAATATPAAGPVEVRTQVIRRTVRVVRHERPRHRAHRAVPAPVASAPTPAIPAAAPAAAPPVTYAAKPPAAPRRSEPLRTRTSGGHAGHSGDDGAQREHEGQDD